MQRFYVINENALCRQDERSDFRLGSLHKLTGKLTVLAHLEDPSQVDSEIEPSDMMLIRLAQQDDFEHFSVDGDYRFAMALQAKETAIPVEEIRGIAVTLRRKYNMLHSDVRTYERMSHSAMKKMEHTPFYIRSRYADFCKHYQRATMQLSSPEMSTFNSPEHCDLMAQILNIIMELRLIRSTPISTEMPQLNEMSRVMKTLRRYREKTGQAASLLDDTCHEVCQSYYLVHQLHQDLVKLKTACNATAHIINSLNDAMIGMTQIYHDYALLELIVSRRGQELPPFFGDGVVEMDATIAMVSNSMFKEIAIQTMAVINLYQNNGSGSDSAQKPVTA